MAPSSEELRNIAEQAEKDLNTYEAKTGAKKTSPSDDAGVDSRVENKFPGSEVKYGEDLSTNAGYNKRIPPSEGGELDDRGRQTRGEHFEGKGGPEHKVAQQQRDFGGNQEFDASGKQEQDDDVPRSTSVTDDTVPFMKKIPDPMPKGKEAVNHNLEQRIPRKPQYKGSDYYTPESVPGSISAEGYEAPESVVEASKESEGY
ncbi:hypothetical protein F4778DRAFT_762603 [Xylariomycetidae sp. FL2044]|nr:hypothetical protein F4778DRAFT_762603 [Xylariomycetidae sp. FL2044]